MKRRGITLLELLTVLVITVFLATSLATSFAAAVRYQTEGRLPREELLSQVAFEDRLSDLIAKAFVDEDLANPNTYFIGQVDPSGDNAGNAGTGATELIFTSMGDRLSGAVAADTESEFEARNQRHGAVGGVTENRLALTAIGDAGDQTGLFLRQQTPSDEDPDQGGFESVVDDRVASIAFEFYDGTDWVAEWDTRTADRRIPAVIRVTYYFVDDETPHELMVKLRNSDVTPNNPANSSATGDGL